MPKFFSRYYSTIARHYFEHIHENRPVRLYFDLEYMVELNKAFCWEDFWPKFKALVQDEYKALCSDELKFLVLDSSTESKFSKHIICQSSFLFENNRCLKPIVANLAEKMRNSGLGVVRSHQRDDDLIMDIGVYDKRRNFRMYLATKYGKTAMLDYDNKSSSYGKQKKSGFVDKFCRGLSVFQKFCLFLEKIPGPYTIFTDSLVIPIDYHLFKILKSDAIPMANGKTALGKKKLGFFYKKLAFLLKFFSVSACCGCGKWLGRHRCLHSLRSGALLTQC